MRKASLSLSMNAIVILILAITLLGLGLSFMRGLFKSMEAKVNVAVSSQELINPPTSDNPITVAPSSISLRGGDDGSITVAFLNNLHNVVNCSLSVCRSGVGTTACDTQANGLCPGTLTGNCSLVYSTARLSMKEDQINTWVLAISPPSTSTAETALYTSKMYCVDTITPHVTEGTFTKDFIVIVKP